MEVVVFILFFTSLLLFVALVRIKTKLSQFDTGELTEDGMLAKEVSEYYEQTLCQIQGVVHDILKNQSFLHSNGASSTKSKKQFYSNIGKLKSLTNGYQQPVSCNNGVIETKPSCCITSNIRPLLNNLSSYAKSIGASLHIQQLENAYCQIPPILLENISRELVINSLSHNPKGVTVIVTGSVECGEYVLSIRDNGIGIKQSKLDRIHDQIAFRLPTGRRFSDFEYTLDLASIYKCISECGGRLEIDSAVQFGTWIRLFIPIDETPESDNQITCKAPFEKIESCDVLYFSKYRQNDFSPWKKALTKQFVVAEASSSEKVMQYLTASPIKIIIIDDTKVSGQGEVLLNMLQTSNIAPDSQIIFISQGLSFEQRVALLQLGANQIVEHPFTVEELLLIVHRFQKNATQTALHVAEAIASYEVYSSDRYCENEHDDIAFFEREFAQCIEKNYQNADFSRSDYANALCMHERTLQRHIAKSFNKNFSQYLRGYRMKRGKALIKSGETVTNAALSVGFSSPSYFSKCFQQEYGYLPSTLQSKLGQ